MLSGERSLLVEALHDIVLAWLPHIDGVLALHPSSSDSLISAGLGNNLFLNLLILDPLRHNILLLSISEVLDALVPGLELHLDLG